MKSKAFTLVEIMIIVVIIAMLAAIAIPAFTRVRFSSIEKDIRSGKTLSSEELRWYREYRAAHPDWSTKPSRNESSDRPSQIKTIEIEGKTFYLVPRNPTSSMTVDGRDFWLVPAPE